MNFFIKKKKYLLPLLGFIFVIVVFKSWFFGNEILTYSDWFYQHPETINSIGKTPSAWLWEQTGGVNLFSYFQPVNALISLLNDFNIEYWLIERVVFLIPLITFSYWGCFFLCFKISNSRLGSILAAWFYIFNTYVLVISSSHITVLSAMSLIPLIFYFLLEYVESYKLKSFISLNILLALCSAYEFRIFYIAIITAFLLCFYNIACSGRGMIGSFRKLSLFSILFILPISLNFYWIYGLSKTGSIASNAFFDRSLFGNEYLNLNKAFSVSHPFWNGTTVSAFTIQKTPLFNWLLPLFAFLGFYFGRKNKWILFFAMISLLGIFLTKQSSIPFPQIYQELYNSFPGFNAFREASKFYILITIGYAVGISFFFSVILGGKKISKHIAFVPFFLFILIILINSWPIFTKKIGTMFVGRQVPVDYVSLNKLILNQDESYKTLWIPRKSKWAINTKLNPIVSFDEVIQNSWKPYSNMSTISASLSNTMLGFIKQDNLDQIIDESGIRYVVVPSVDYQNDDDFFAFYLPRNMFVDELNNVSSLSKVDLGISNINVFENKNYLNLIDLYSWSKNQTLSFERISAVNYKVILNNVSLDEEIQIVFSNMYDSNWKLLDGRLQNEIAFEHSPSKFGYNLFEVKMIDICKKVECHSNPDGTYKAIFNIYNVLQNKFNTGIRYSALILLTAPLAVYLLLILRKNEKN